MTSPIPRDPVVLVEGLRAGYAADGAAREVLAGLDLRIEGGELVAVLGPNGGGKTTLLRCLAGTLRPWAGRVELFGRPVAQWDRMALARSVAVLPQSLELPDGFRVAELVEMARLPHARRPFGSTAADIDAVERALRHADALDLAERQAADLSGGERQRAVVAMALAQEPRLLLLDEPTLHLDVGHQAALVEAVEGLRRSRDLTVVAVLHDINLAIAVAPRVVLVDRGRVVGDGAPESVLGADAVRRAFGRSLDEALTADGRRYLVPRAARPVQATAAQAAPSAHPRDEPFEKRTGTNT